jgi:hypothetical protein
MVSVFKFQFPKLNFAVPQFVRYCTQAGIISKAEQALAERGKADARPHGVARQPQSRQVNARPLAAPLNR